MPMADPRQAGGVISAAAAPRFLKEPGGGSIFMAEGQFRAVQVILSLPSRLVAGLAVAGPGAPTWMAGHAQLVATYPRAF